MELNGSAQQADITTTEPQHLDTADTGSQVKFDGSREDLLRFIETKVPLSAELRTWISMAYAEFYLLPPIMGRTDSRHLYVLCLAYAMPSLLNYFNEYRKGCEEYTWKLLK